MELYLKQITPDMTTAVNRLKRDNFENASADEIEKYAEFVKLTALQSKELEENAQLRRERLKADMEQNAAKTSAAIEALNALTEVAKAKLRMIEGKADGQNAK